MEVEVCNAEVAPIRRKGHHRGNADVIDDGARRAERNTHTCRYFHGNAGITWNEAYVDQRYSHRTHGKSDREGCVQTSAAGERKPVRTRENQTRRERCANAFGRKNGFEQPIKGVGVNEQYALGALCFESQISLALVTRHVIRKVSNKTRGDVRRLKTTPAALSEKDQFFARFGRVGQDHERNATGDVAACLHLQVRRREQAQRHVIRQPSLDLKRDSAVFRELTQRLIDVSSRICKYFHFETRRFCVGGGAHQESEKIEVCWTIFISIMCSRKREQRVKHISYVCEESLTIESVVAPAICVMKYRARIVQ